MTEEKSKTSLKYLNGYYVGKEYKRTFDNEDGSQTKSFKYKFQMKSGEEDKELAFWGYDTTKGVDSLEGQEGELFTLGYLEVENPKGDYPIKKVRFFGKPKGEVSDLQKHDHPSTLNAPDSGTTQATKRWQWRDIKHLMKIYKEQIPEAENTCDLFFRMSILNEPNSELMERCEVIEKAWEAEFGKKNEELKR